MIYQEITFKICLSLFGWKENILDKMHIVHCCSLLLDLARNLCSLTDVSSPFCCRLRATSSPSLYRRQSPPHRSPGSWTPSWQTASSSSSTHSRGPRRSHRQNQSQTVNRILSRIWKQDKIGMVFRTKNGLQKIQTHPESIVFNCGLAVVRFLAFFRTELAVSSSSSAVTWEQVILYYFFPA